MNPWIPAVICMIVGMTAATAVFLLVAGGLNRKHTEQVIAAIQGIHDAVRHMPIPTVQPETTITYVPSPEIEREDLDITPDQLVKSWAAEERAAGVDVSNADMKEQIEAWRSFEEEV